MKPYLNWKRLRRCLSGTALVLAMLGGLCSIGHAERDESSMMNPESEPQAEQPANQQAAQRPAYLVEFGNAVKAYREGDYLQAKKILHPLHAQHPENSRITYYLAIAEAQLGRFQQAKTLYQEILALDPNGEAAPLATEGLKFLPAETAMDLPPRFQENNLLGANAQTPVNQQAMGQGNASQGASPSPQEWMALQMMMGQNGLSGTGGMNAMPWMTQGTNATGGSSYGTGSLDPNAMSSMMMNQMLQNFTLGGDQDNNR